MKEILELLFTLSQELKSVKAYLEVFHKTRFQKVGESWIDIDQATSILRISTQTLRKLRNEGLLAFSKINTKIYFKMDDIENLLNDNYTQIIKEVQNDNN